MGTVSVTTTNTACVEHSNICRDLFANLRGNGDTMLKKQENAICWTVSPSKSPGLLPLSSQIGSRSARNS